MTEAFTWNTAAFVGGSAAGAAIAGAVAESAGAPAAFALLGGCALAAAAIAVNVRRRLALAQA
jgi:hypothetical protein